MSSHRLPCRKHSALETLQVRSFFSLFSELRRRSESKLCPLRMLCLCTHIYVHLGCMSLHSHVCVHIHMYIYIYRYGHIHEFLYALRIAICEEVGSGRSRYSVAESCNKLPGHPGSPILKLHGPDPNLRVLYHVVCVRWLHISLAIESCRSWQYAVCTGLTCQICKCSCKA